MLHEVSVKVKAYIILHLAARSNPAGYATCSRRKIQFMEIPSSWIQLVTARVIWPPVFIFRWRRSMSNCRPREHYLRNVFPSLTEAKVVLRLPHKATHAHLCARGTTFPKERYNVYGFLSWLTFITKYTIHHLHYYHIITMLLK